MWNGSRESAIEREGGERGEEEEDRKRSVARKK